MGEDRLLWAGAKERVWNKPQSTDTSTLDGSKIEDYLQPELTKITGIQFMEMNKRKYSKIKNPSIKLISCS